MEVTSEIKMLGPGWGQRGEMTQALYAHMNNKRKKQKYKKTNKQKKNHNKGKKKS
jgi:hypothetical protein